MNWQIIEAWFVAWAFGSLLGTLLAAKYERIKKMLPMIMIAGIVGIVIMLLYTSIPYGVNNSVDNSVEELNRIMTELQNQAPK